MHSETAVVTNFYSFSHVAFGFIFLFLPSLIELQTYFAFWGTEWMSVCFLHLRSIYWGTVRRRLEAGLGTGGQKPQQESTSQESVFTTDI